MPTAIEDMPDLEDASDFRSALRAFRPEPDPGALAWSKANIVNDQGRPYDEGAYPHLGAPGGPFDALDDQAVREISLQWATRLGKSFFGQCATLKFADVNPAPQMFASSTEKLAKEIVGRSYAMIEARPRLARLLVKAKKFRRQDLIELRRSRVFAAWARSVSTLADKNVKYGHANEIDKWEQASTSKEAEPLKLFTDRFKDFQSSRKVIFEGTPTISGHSRIERKLLAGTNCRFFVPCPDCKRYQTLDFGDGTGSGVVWEKPENGRSDADLAKRTAGYRCAHCKTVWHDHTRAWSMRRGVWAPAGCTINDKAARREAEGPRKPWRGWRHAAWIKGTPLRDGEEASYQLSSLYALALTWGDLAKEFIESKDRPQLLRNFRNQWLGLTWARKKSRSGPAEVGGRLAGSTPRGTVPVGAGLLTVSIDRQGEDEGYVKYAVLAHGLEERAWLIEYGIAGKPEDLWDSVLRRHYPHADRGAPLQPGFAVIDSGFKTHETYQFCARHPGILPVKGASNDLGGQAYRVVTLGEEGRKLRSGAEGQVLCHIATDYWETELQARLDERPLGSPGSLELCPEAARDAEFLEELCNGILSDGEDPRGNPRLLWIKKDPHFPNDFRDCVRYGLCAARIWLDQQGGAYPSRAAEARPRSSVLNPGIGRPDGRAWNER